MSQGGGVPGRLWKLVGAGRGFWAERRSSAEALRILSSLLQTIKSYKQLPTVLSCQPPQGMVNFCCVLGKPTSWTTANHLLPFIRLTTVDKPL